MKSNRWFKIINCDETIFDCIDTFHAYFLGLVAADGNIPQSKKFLTITQSHEVGYKLLKQLATYLNHSGNLYYQEKSDAYTIYINSTKIVEFVEKYNIAPRKSLTFEYPSELPPHLFPYFIRGYFDGDGSLGYYKTNTSRIFVMSVVGTEMFIKSCNELFPIKGAIRNLKKILGNLDGLERKH